MKPLATSLVLSLSTVFLLTQCAAPVQTVRPAVSQPSTTVAAARPAVSGGNVTIKNFGDTSVATKRLINRPLTNKDIGKVYEVVTYASPLGVKSEERIIVRTTPKLQTKVVSR